KVKLLKFFTAFTVSLMVMSIPWGLCFYRVSHKAISPRQEEKISSLNISLLLNLEGAKESSAFLEVDIKGQKITLRVLPPLLLGEDCGKFKSLGEIWKTDGGKYAVAALNKTYNLNIEKWACMTWGDFSKICDLLGCCDFTLESDITDENGNLLLPRGRQILNGTGLLLLLQRESSGDFLLPYHRFGEGLSGLLRDGSNIFTNGEEEKLFNLLANSADNNLDIYDLTALQSSDFFKAPLKVTDYKIKGALSADGKLFLPN
ncbi:MAG: LCP family protein, partial [Oscillospiraceae bacterium]